MRGLEQQMISDSSVSDAFLSRLQPYNVLVECGNGWTLISGIVLFIFFSPVEQTRESKQEGGPRAIEITWNEDRVSSQTNSRDR